MFSCCLKSVIAALPMPIHKHRNFAAHSIGYLHSSLQYAKASYVLSHNTDPVSLDTPNALAPKQILMMQEPVPGCDNPYPPYQSKADLDRMHVLFLPPISTAANHHFLQSQDLDSSSVVLLTFYDIII